MPAESAAVAILIVEDVPDLRKALVRSLERPGRRLIEAADAATARRLIDADRPDVILLDLGIPAAEGGAAGSAVGLALMTELTSGGSGRRIIVLTGSTEEPVVIEATRAGAVQYLVKPPSLDHLERIVAEECARAARDRAATPVAPATDAPKEFLVGGSQAMVGIKARIAVIASSTVPVLVTGETGTGKERAAQAIHAYSPRRTGPFVTVDCAGLSPTLLESELFGHEKGAFTDAHAARAGRFEQADGGTLFLDEIGNIPPEVQAKLLRAVENGRGFRVGGTREIGWDVRLVSATNADLGTMVASGTFKPDLLQRLKGETITLPPLRDRRDDIRPLALHFLSLIPDKPGLRITEEALAILRECEWPGNVRELGMAIRRAAAFCRNGVLSPEDLPDSLRISGALQRAGIVTRPGKDGLVSMDEVRERYARYALAACGGNQSEAARLLKIDRGTLKSLLADEDPAT